MQQPRRQGHPYRRARHPARPRAQAAGKSSSTPGRSRASSRRGCSPPSSAGARTRRPCRPAAAATTSAADAAIYLSTPGAATRVRSWTPTAQAQHGFLVTHNESISIADYFTLREGGKAGLPADLPLRLSPLQRCGAVAARDGRRRLGAAADVAHPRRARHRRRRRRARRAGLRPRQERLLVRLVSCRSRRRGSSRPTRTPPACR